MIHYPNVLILRLRMPVSDDLHGRNFVTKITKYDRVVDIPNVSVTCVFEHITCGLTSILVKHNPH